MLLRPEKGKVRLVSYGLFNIYIYIYICPMSGVTRGFITNSSKPFFNQYYRCCTDPNICECAADGVECHGNACMCLLGPLAVKKPRCGNPAKYYLYEEGIVNKRRKAKLKQANSGKW